MKEGWTRKLMALMACCLLASHSIADPQPEADAARIEKLEKLVSSLEKRVSALESPSGQIPAPVQGVQNQSAWENKTNWRSLRKGMKKAEVRSLLGEPDKIDATGPVEDWRWGGPTGPNLYFVNERLSGWSEPD
jgi:outer membrane protein assembly factor BamE (lipoprotein component of BamABCDE complex)